MYQLQTHECFTATGEGDAYASSRLPVGVRARMSFSPPTSHRVRPSPVGTLHGPIPIEREHVTAARMIESCGRTLLRIRLQTAAGDCSFEYWTCPTDGSAMQILGRIVEGDDCVRAFRGTRTASEVRVFSDQQEAEAWLAFSLPRDDAGN